MNTKNEYLSLLSKSYNEVVEHLLAKYEPAQDDYFRENSYQRFLKGEIKNITKGNYKRSAEGLECHHIDENKFLNMSQNGPIKSQEIPFRYHKKERLVFANIIEHAILHVLITKETDFEFGFPGYQVHLRSKIEDWYINRLIPRKSNWHINCYHTSYVTDKEAVELLEVMDGIIDSKREHIEKEKLRVLKKRVHEEDFQNLTSENTSDEIIYAMYELSKIGALGFHHELNILNDKGFTVFKRPFNDYKTRMEIYDLDSILKSVYLFIEYVEGKLNYKGYLHNYSQLVFRTKEQVRAEKKQQEKLALKRNCKNNEFYTIYPKFKEINIEYDIGRSDVNYLLFKNDPHNKHRNFMDVQKSMKPYSLEELLEKLHSVLDKL